MNGNTYNTLHTLESENANMKKKEKEKSMIGS